MLNSSAYFLTNEHLRIAALEKWTLPQYQLDYVLMEPNDYDLNINIDNNNNNSNDVMIVDSTTVVNSDAALYSSEPLFTSESPLSTSCDNADSNSGHGSINSNTKEITNPATPQSLEPTPNKQEVLRNCEQMKDRRHSSHGSTEEKSPVGLTPSMSCLRLNCSSRGCSSSSLSSQPQLCNVTRESSSEQASRQRQEELPLPHDACCVNFYKYDNVDVKNNLNDDTGINNKNIKNCKNQADYNSTNDNISANDSCCVTDEEDSSEPQTVLFPVRESNSYLIVNVATDGKVYLLPTKSTEVFFAQNTLEKCMETRVSYDTENNKSSDYSDVNTSCCTLGNEECTSVLPSSEKHSQFLFSNADILYESNTPSSELWVNPYSLYIASPIIAWSTSLSVVEDTDEFLRNQCNICNINTTSTTTTTNNNNNNNNNSSSNNSNYTCNRDMSNDMKCCYNNVAATPTWRAVTCSSEEFDKQSSGASGNTDLHVLSDEKWAELLKSKGVRWHYDPYQVNLLNDDDHANEEWDTMYATWNNNIDHNSYHSNNIYERESNVTYNSMPIIDINNEQPYLYATNALPYTTYNNNNYNINFNNYYWKEEHEIYWDQQEERQKCREFSQEITNDSSSCYHHSYCDQEVEQEHESWHRLQSESEQAASVIALSNKKEKRNDEEQYYYYEEEEQEEEEEEEEEELVISHTYQQGSCRQEQHASQIITHTPERVTAITKTALTFTENNTPNLMNVTPQSDTPSSRRFPSSKTCLKYCVLPPLSEVKSTPSKLRHNRVKCTRLFDTTTTAATTTVDEQPLCKAQMALEHSSTEMETRCNVCNHNDSIQTATHHISSHIGCTSAQEKDNIHHNTGLVHSPSSSSSSSIAVAVAATVTPEGVLFKGDKTCFFNERTERKLNTSAVNKLRKTWLRDAQLQSLHDLWYAACTMCNFGEMMQNDLVCDCANETISTDHEDEKDVTITTTTTTNNAAHEQMWEEQCGYGRQTHSNHLNQCHCHEYNSPHYKHNCLSYQHKSRQELRHKLKISFTIRPNLHLECMPCVNFRYVYVLRHHHRRSFAVSSRLFYTNSLVIADGDRGVEMGAVEAVYSESVLRTMTKYELEEAGLLEQNVNTTIRVHRLASESESMYYMNTLPYLELCTLNFLYQLQRSSYFNTCAIQTMEFVSCEFQADCQKLYVYYRSPIKVRILELATFLYQIYPCRI